MPISPRAAVIDTNILVYAHFQDSSHYRSAYDLLERGREIDAELYVTPQVIAEFYAVVTHPKRVSNPFTAAEAVAAIEQVLSLPGISLLHPSSNVVERWLQLARDHSIIGNNIFDVQLIATMLSRDVRRIYTFDESDFRVFSEIEVLQP